MPDSAGHGVIYLNLGISLFAVFALRGIYFALLQETRTPKHITWRGRRLISVVGYTPEIFFAPIAGRILDGTPGVGGFSEPFHAAGRHNDRRCRHSDVSCIPEAK